MKIEYDQKRGKKIANLGLKIFKKRYREIQKENSELIPGYVDFYQRETLAVGKWYSNVTVFDLKNGRLFRVLPAASKFPKVMEAFLQTNPTYKTIETRINEFLFRNNWLATGNFIVLIPQDLWRKDAQGLFDRLIKERIWVYLYVTEKGHLDLRFSSRRIKEEVFP